ncbi:MAG TPA: FUSC family protein [Candidatus Acidoferrales bacterium]|jgi:uncharacterized membrane protein YccC|nr:FUSC family protein [Candidatus Acidoferrales bacterium]
MADAKKQKWPHVSQQEIVHAVRTAIAAVASLLIARLFRLPEAYWAAIATMIVMQSTLGAAWSISKDRLAGTALGAAAGALLATYAGQNIAVFGAGVFALGVICAILRVERGAYRYAGITLVIVMLIARTQAPWIVAIHRFIEISVGIGVGLSLTAAWPERQTTPA